MAEAWLIPMKTGNHYKSGIHHLSDEMAQVDVLVRRLVSKHRRTQPGLTVDAFYGLNITGEEVDMILNETKEQEDICETQTGGDLRRAIDSKVKISLEHQVYLPLVQLSGIFCLTPLERGIMTVCLAPEWDLKYETLYAYLQNDINKRQPTVALTLELLCRGNEEKINSRWCFLPQSSLFKYGLVTFTGDTEGKPLLTRYLKVDDRIVDFLLGFDSLDHRLRNFCRYIEPLGDWDSLILSPEIKEPLKRLAGEYLERDSGNRPVFYFYGPYGSGRKTAAQAFCRQLQLPLLLLECRELAKSGVQCKPLLRLFFREALLRQAAVYLDGFGQCLEDEAGACVCRDALFKVLEEYPLLTFLAGETAWRPAAFGTKTGDSHLRLMPVRFPRPAYPLRKALWEQTLGDRDMIPISPDVDKDALAGRFQLTGGQMRDALEDARAMALKRDGKEKASVTMNDLYRGCRDRSNQKLAQLAQKITPHYNWTDIVLPHDTLCQLKEITLHIRHRHTVFHRWGFQEKLSLGKGLNVLFHGPSGTGKTMAAEVVANELGLDLYKIDLSSVVSKYIGETEKNLAGIFKEAETANAVLFFDEADALFGKRSEVKDAHDRYANIETGYLLQKMEEYEGVVILATNLKNNMDDAFVRRMQFILEYPFPDEASRERIWKSIFPPQTPLDSELDYEFLTRNLDIPGGSIKNIALAAAFYAAGDGGVVTMEHLVHACKREFLKMGKLCLKQDFGKYYQLVQL